MTWRSNSSAAAFWRTKNPSFGHSKSSRRVQILAKLLQHFDSKGQMRGKWFVHT